MTLEDAFRSHGQRLAPTAKAMTFRATWDDAEDAAATAWTILARRTDILDSPTWWAWLKVVAINECRRLVAERTPLTDNGDVPEPATVTVDPLDRLTAHDDLHAAIEKVRPSQREELLMQAAGYSYNEIADILGVTYTHVNRSVTEGSRDARGEPRPARLPRPRGRGGGRRYPPHYRTNARRLRALGWSAPQIAAELGTSLRTAQVWTRDVKLAEFTRACAHCDREFTTPVVAHGIRKYCSDQCSRYAFAARRNPRRRARALKAAA